MQLRRRRSITAQHTPIHQFPAFVGIPAACSDLLRSVGRAAVATALCAALVTPVHAAHSLSAPMAPTRHPAVQLDAEHALAEEAWSVVNRYYLDGSFHGTSWATTETELAHTPLPSRSATYRAIRAALSNLKDPYTRLLTPADMAALRKFDVSGVGILLTAGATDELVVATTPAPGTPAAIAGVQRGDVLQAVDGVDVSGRGASDVAELMHGEDDTDIALRFRDRGDVTLRRKFEKGGKTPVHSYLVKGENGLKVGHIVLSEFQASGRGDVGRAVEELHKKGANAYVLDVRGNPGGIFQGALEIAGIFEGGGKPVANVTSRADTKTYKSVVVDSIDPEVAHAPLAIVVDENSASSSEVLAGGLRDGCRAAIVGQRNSYGKGLIQGVFALSDGSGLVLTVAGYETPRGTIIQGAGLQPDFGLEEGCLDKLLPRVGVYAPAKVDFGKVDHVVRMCGAQVNS